MITNYIYKHKETKEIFKIVLDSEVKEDTIRNDMALRMALDEHNIEEDDLILNEVLDEELINISQKLHIDLIATLERTQILMRDNPNIKDKEDFYTSDQIEAECIDLLKYLNGEL